MKEPSARSAKCTQPASRAPGVSSVGDDPGAEGLEVVAFGLSKGVVREALPYPAFRKSAGCSDGWIESEEPRATHGGAGG